MQLRSVLFSTLSRDMPMHSTSYFRQRTSLSAQQTCFLSGAISHDLRAPHDRVGVRHGATTSFAVTTCHLEPPIIRSLALVTQGSGFRPVVRLLYRPLEGIRQGQIYVDALGRDWILEPMNIELLKLAGAHQLGERVIDQCLELR